LKKRLWAAQKISRILCPVFWGLRDLNFEGDTTVFQDQKKTLRRKTMNDSITQVALVAIAAVVMVGLYNVYDDQVKGWADSKVQNVITETGGGPTSVAPK
jgi:hypothetical protein